MSNRSTKRAALSAGVAALALATIAAQGARAAASPLRSISYAPDGNRFSGFEPLALSADGSKAIGIFSPSAGLDDFVADPEYGTAGGGRPILRDLATQKTTFLPGLGTDDRPVAYSDDLSKLIIQTTQSYSSHDTNGVIDFYLYDPATGAKTLLSRDAAGNAIGWDTSTLKPAAKLAWPALSGDGKVAEFSVGSNPVGSGPSFTWQTFRLDTTTGALTKVADQQGATTHLDDAGQISVTANAVYVGDKKYDAPNGFTIYGAAVSPDGSYVAANDGSNVYTFNTHTLEVKTLPVPSWAKGTAAYWQTAAVKNDGTAIIDTVGDSAKFPKFQVGQVTQSGQLSQLGVDMPLTTEISYLHGVISPNGLFALSPLQLQALGSTPVPGTEPTPTTAVVAGQYTQLTSARCQYDFGFYQVYSKPYVTLSDTPHGADLRIATKANVTVTNSSTGQVMNQFALTPAQSRNLSAGSTGGYTITSTFTFNDGSTSTGSQVVGARPSPSCGVGF